MSDYSELKRVADESVGFFDVPIAPDVVLGLIYEVEGLRAQHVRDSAELRRLCQARDDARKERDQLKAEVDRLTADNTSLRGSCAKLGAEHAGMVRQIKKLKGAKP